jgi:hypothetical protein
VQKQLYRICLECGCSRAAVWYGLAWLRVLGITLLCAVAIVVSAFLGPRLLLVVLVLAGIVILLEVRDAMYTTSAIATGIGVLLVALMMGACVYGILRTLCGHYVGAGEWLLTGVMYRCVQLNVGSVAISTVASPVIIKCLILWVKLRAWIEQRLEDL